MCGIAGFWQKPDVCDTDRQRLAQQMAGALIHRGPDDQGVWSEATAGIALTHRRLSILDLSATGHQPMRSSSGRYVIAFNGEIYNWQALREALDKEDGAPAWRGRSDTEVMLACFERWGIASSLRRFVGMFAFALWDREQRALHLARDRMGEKPLYYGWTGGVFLFGSELKALRAHPRFTASLDPAAVELYLRYACVPAPCSIYAGIFKLLPGTLLTFSAEQLARGGEGAAASYWSLSAIATEGTRQPFNGSAEEAAQVLERLLRAAVAGQMIADVPLGAFLSGGVDSSTVVALMQAQSASRVKTFTIGFTEQAYNEAGHARAVASHLGTEHTELLVTPQQALNVVPDLPAMYDEPFGDSSQIPTHLVARLARAHVTVSLSGDGGDELFGGYNRYTWGRRLRRYAGWLPQRGRQAMADAITRISPSTWDAWYARVLPLMPKAMRHTAAGDKLHKLAGLLGAGGDSELYQQLVSLWQAEAWPARADGAIPSVWAGCPVPSALSSLPERMMYLDALGYLPDDILVKVDRAAMAVGLETRIPLLDHRLVEFAWRLPLRLRMHGGKSKWLLRQVLYRHVPRELIERPKKGFGIPIDAWLRGPLRDWAESLLSEEALSASGLLNPAPIRRKWLEHQSGARNWQHPLWVILMLQAWLERSGS
jgi:asparagine synthase (glutamine-hydrolysing)